MSRAAAKAPPFPCGKDGAPAKPRQGTRADSGRIGPQDENANAKAITTEDTENTEKSVTERDSAKS